MMQGPKKATKIQAKQEGPPNNKKMNPFDDEKIVSNVAEISKRLGTNISVVSNPFEDDVDKFLFNEDDRNNITKPSVNNNQDDEDGDDYELHEFLEIACEVNNVSAYMLANTAAFSTTSYSAEEMKKNPPIFTGKLLVKVKGAHGVIELHDAVNQSLFASCPLSTSQKTTWEEKCVSRCTDSSRYFVIRVVNAGKKAFLGISFKERNESFDFCAAISDFDAKKKKQMEFAAAAKKKQSSELGSVSNVTSAFSDLSIKQGQTISLKLEKIGGKEVKKESTTTSSSKGNVIPLLAPPPSTTKR